MKNFLLVLLLSFASLLIKASPGDTTWVHAHDKVDMVWYGAYDTLVAFPDGNTTYHKILMYYTMGCATGGCSDWDYTTKIEARINTGMIDSNISSIDTISLTPLVIDTNWNVFEVFDPFELGRVITPYGNALSNDWTHTFVFDVTDYAPILKDSIIMRAFYSGWSSGFSATVKFAMIEGTPARNVVKLENAYRGSWGYRNSVDFETEHLPLKNFSLEPATQQVVYRTSITGHGFGNAQNCAEFCERDYYVDVDGQRRYTQAIWRDNCGLNPIWPQAGTWLYDRANWCPGDRSYVYDHDLTSFINGSNFDLNMDIEAYNIPTGQNGASYIIDAQLFQFEAPNFKHDVELVDIISPSADDEFGRMNPVCGKAVITIRNKGSEPLTSCTIEYGMHGAKWKTFNWTGDLKFLESEDVELPMDEPADWLSYTGKMQFRAKVYWPNGKVDQNPHNEWHSTSFEAPATYPDEIRLLLKTNNAGSETFWSVNSIDGTVIASGDNLANSTNYTENISLAPGCYYFLVGDRDKDGLNFFGNNDGTGSVTIRNNGGNFFIRSFNPNFGTEIREYFTVGYEIGIDEETIESFIDIYPNPAKDILNVQFHVNGNEDVKIALMDLSGRKIIDQKLSISDLHEHRIDLNGMARGMYELIVEMDGKRQIEKVLVQ